MALLGVVVVGSILDLVDCMAVGKVEVDCTLVVRKLDYMLGHRAGHRVAHTLAVVQVAHTLAVVRKVGRNFVHIGVEVEDNHMDL